MICICIAVILNLSSSASTVQTYYTLLDIPTTPKQTLSGLLLLGPMYFGLSILLLYTAILGFSHKRKFIGWAILILWIAFLISWYAVNLGNSGKNNFIIVVAFMGSLVWTLYLRKSVRVQNTFTK